jgi:hypothetical protein
MVRSFAKIVLILFTIACFSLRYGMTLAQDMLADYQEALKTLDHKGDFKTGVLKVNIPRTDLKITIAGVATPTPLGFGGWISFTKDTEGTDVMMGDLVLLQEEVNPVGLNTWAAFVGTQEDAAIAGDIAMLENEITPVLKSLRKNNIDVVAIHHHMTEDRPVVIFLHYWGRGSADKLAGAFKAALDELGCRRRRKTEPFWPVLDGASDPPRAPLVRMR